MSGLDAHSRPPDSLRTLMKHWQKTSPAEIDKARDIIDLARRAELLQRDVDVAVGLEGHRLQAIFSDFTGKDAENLSDISTITSSCFELKAIPGLFIFPALLPLSVQAALLNKMLHRDLSNKMHANNLDLHYEVPSIMSHKALGTDPRPVSFFEVDPDILIQPKDHSIHKPLTVKQMLDRKLRWVTLGGQYNWTAKMYPSEQPPAFPPDVGQFLHAIWPNVDAQAAIVNLYTPGDTLSVHRDVSEECDRGLISISIGCDALFLVGNENGSKHATIRLHSGDAILMSNEARYAWHAVPKVISDTCPKALQEWPYLHDEEHFQKWKGWLKNKRINLNVRQMRATS